MTRVVNSRPATLERLRKRLLELRAEILSEGDVAIEPARTDPTAVGGSNSLAWSAMTFRPP